MKKLLISTFGLLLANSAYAAGAQQFTLSAAVEDVHVTSVDKLIGLDGTLADNYTLVNLADGSSLKVISPLVQVANSLCDTATVRPSGGRIIYCIAK
jgi:hypothetical protein